MSEHGNASGVVARRAVAQYQREQVNALSQKELLLMLYDGAIRFCEDAKLALAERDYNTSYQRLTRVRQIVMELLSILNPDIEADVVTNLRRLYDFCIYGVTEVNLTKDTGLLDAVVNVLRNLRSAWADVDFSAAVRELEAAFADSQAAGAPPAPQAAPPAAPPEPETRGLSLKA